eukprot:jgi/Tetstr1/463521/TSEL_008400.t1
MSDAPPRLAADESQPASKEAPPVAKVGGLAAIPRPVPTFDGTPIVSSVQRNKAVSLPLAGTAASPKLHGLVGVLAQQQKRAGGTTKHNTNAVKNLAATQAVPGDNVDEGSSPEPPAKKAKQPAKPAAGPGGPGW